MIKNLKTVDLNLLVIFEAVYATRNISRAADRLAMSQPAVSNALTRLRELIDDPLFVRAPKGVEPTIKARELIDPVREALGLIGRHLGTGTELDWATYQRVFRVVVVDSMEPIIMPPVVRTMLSQAPGVGIECVQAHPKVSEEIRTGTIDLACFPFPLDNIAEIIVKPVCPADMVIVTRRDHPGITRPLDLETFRRLPHIGLNNELRSLTSMDKNLAPVLESRRLAYMASKIWSIPAMVERTDLLGMLPRAFVNEIAGNFDFDVHEFPVELPEQHIYLMWHRKSNLDPGHIWLRQTMMLAAQAHLLPDAPNPRSGPSHLAEPVEQHSGPPENQALNVGS
jgi:DNA-binding transcriptional LysR family regulator